MGGNHSPRGTQCVGHVRIAPAIDVSIGRSGVTTSLVLDWFSQSDSCRSQCYCKFINDCRIGYDVVVLVINGSIFDVVVIVYGFWIGILLRFD